MHGPINKKVMGWRPSDTSEKRLSETFSPSLFIFFGHKVSMIQWTQSVLTT